MNKCPKTYSGDHNWHAYEVSSSSDSAWFSLKCGLCEIIDIRVEVIASTHSGPDMKDVIKRLLDKQFKIDGIMND